MRELDEHEVLRRATCAARGHWADATVCGLNRLPGGVSSLTFAATLRTGRQECTVVIKVAPPGLRPIHNRDVLRQARALRSLRPLSGFPVPTVLFEDDGDPPLFVMEYRDGGCYEPMLDSGAPPAAELVGRRMRIAAKALARLHGAAPSSLGLDSEPATPVAEELARWQRLFATIDPDLAPDHDRLYARLAAQLPADTVPAVSHGDYRLANMLFTEAELVAVIDWEIWSIGDPRCDLAWLLMHTAPAHVLHERRADADIAAANAVPPAADLLVEYIAGHSGAAAATVDELDWFLALSYYKTASTLAALIKRDRLRTVRDPQLVVAERHLDEVLAAGHRALDEPQLRRA